MSGDIAYVHTTENMTLQGIFGRTSSKGERSYVIIMRFVNRSYVNLKSVVPHHS